MSDPLSDTFRSNAEAFRAAWGMNWYQFGRIVTPHEKTQYRTQITRGLGFTLATVHAWCARLDVPVSVMLTEGGAQVWLARNPVQKLDKCAA